MRRRAAAAGLLLAAAAAAPEPPQTPAATAAPIAASAPAARPAALVTLDPPAAPGAFAPFLARAGEALLATWLEPEPGGGQRVRFARHEGGTWGPAATVAAGRDLFANWADTPGVVAAGDGTLYAWWLAKSAAATYAYDAWLARSEDGGASFRPLGRLNDDGVAAEHGFVSAVAEGDGARFFFLDGRATPAGGATALRTALAAAGRIGASELVDDAVCDCCATATVALPGGAAVAYRDRAAGEIRDIRLLVRGRDGTTAAIPVGDDHWQIAGCPVNGPALAAAGERLAVAWFTAPADRARVAVALSNDGGRSLGPERRLDAAAPVGRVATAALGAEGFAVAWLARAGDRAELRLARVDPRGNVGAVVAVARLPAGRASGVPRLVAAGADLLIAWTEPEPAPGRIRVARLLDFAAP